MVAKFAMLAASAAVSAGTCLGQASTTLYLVKAENFDQLCSPESSPGVPSLNNAYWIGHNPTAIAYGKGNLYIGGMLNGSSLPLDGADVDADGNTTEITPFNISIVRVNSILTTPSFSPIPGSRYSVAANGLGFTGLDYAANQGTTVRGLVACYDTNGGGTNLISRYNVDTGVVTIVAPAPSLFTGFRAGSCGPAWDFGPTGNGVDYAPSGALDGVPDGPAVAAVEFWSFGPYGTDPSTLNAGFGATLYEVGFNNGPRFCPDTESQRLWRDLSIDRRNGNIAVRADNTLLFFTRNTNGTTTRVDLAPTDPTTERFVTAVGSFINNQHVSIMTGYDPAGVGDLMVWNDRPSASVGQPFSSVVRFNKTNRANAADSGAVVTATFLNPDGSPASFAPGTGLYDFFWDDATNILFICDAANRNVYLVSAEQPRACCTPIGACFLLNPSACTAPEVGGIAGAAGSICSPNPCLSTGGACCGGTVCTISTAGSCIGAFRGLGTTCDFVGNPVTCCRANFNQIGGITVQDIFDFLTAYFGNHPTADINGVGGVTVQDIFDYLALYFAGCAV
jgi:hypothetical protein